MSADKNPLCESLIEPDTTFRPLIVIAADGRVPSHTSVTSATSSTVADRPVAEIAVTL